MDSTVVIEPAYNALSDVRALFEAYTAMLVTHDPAFQIYLDIQHYADELRAPAAKYAPPDGRLYLARVDGRAVGCIALRRLDGERCEMKRLYVQPQYPGPGACPAADPPDHRGRAADRLPLYAAGHPAGSGGCRPPLPAAGILRDPLLQRQPCGVHTVFPAGPVNPAST